MQFTILNYAYEQICIPNKELMDKLTIDINYDKETKKHWVDKILRLY